MSTILSIQNVSKTYNKQVALENVSFNVYSGQIVGLLGPNGSGKTTLIKIINSLITNYEGEISICGHEPGIAAKGLTSYLPDVEFLRKDLRVSTALKLYADFFSDFDIAKAREMLVLVKLNERQIIRTMSKGMKEKLQLVLTMSRRAMLYIFDEPIAGVDPAARQYILDTIIRNYNEKGAILFSTHLITDVEGLISRAVFIKEGRIVLDGEADAIRAERGMSIDQLFREEFKC
ncbi:MAG: ABC transporter ATP-binding protein [Oscillospiraceae bacterium]|nr:ABC transporter ATP-binding protein [Oscillospiraceae bacterium]